MTCNARTGGLVLAVVVVVTALAACGTKTLSSDDVAKDVKSQALTSRGVKGTVKCPDETKAEKGKKVKCAVRDSERNKGSVTATVKDEDGNLTIAKPNIKDLQLAVIEKNAADAGRSKGVDGKVDCGSGSEPKRNAIYFCTATISGSGRGILIVTQRTAASDVSVKVQRRKLRTRQIEASIKKALAKQSVSATVSCPARVTSQKGSTFSCRLKGANGRTLTVVARQTDDEGNFSLKVKR